MRGIYADEYINCTLSKIFLYNLNKIRISNQKDNKNLKIR